MRSRGFLGSTAVLAMLLAGSTSAATLNEHKHRSSAPETVSDTTSALRDSAGHVYGPIAAEVTTSLKGFSSEVIVADMYEVEAARIALKRTQDPRIADFARQMIKAHLRTSDRLRTVLAGISNIRLLPNHLDSRRQRMIDELRGAKRGSFDGRYLSQQVDSHNEALILLRRYDHSGDVRAAKLFARETIPAVRMHLSLAQQLLSDHDRRS